MKITIVAGARPNFMKIAPITRAIEAARALGKSISYRLVYTGKKEDTSLDASLFSDLDMKAPDVYLGVESSKTRNQSGASGGGNPFLRHENAERSKPYDHRRAIRLSVHCRYGCQP